MPATLVELRPNRRLLDHNFEGYKLNLNALPHWKHDLSSPVDKVYPDEVQYSFLHAKLFALHNHLVADSWSHYYTLYYIDKKQHVRHVKFNTENHSFHNSIVYDIPAHVERKSGHFNLCLALPSTHIAVVSDGTGYLHIVSTEDRNDPDHMWRTLHSSLVLGENKYFVMIDCRIQEKDDSTAVHCLLQSVEQIDKHFCSNLTWVSYENIDDIWKQTSMRQLQGKGIVHYAAIETNFTALYIACDNKFKFISDSEKEITEPVKEECKPIIYTWLQTTEDITIAMKLPGDHDKGLLDIAVNPFDIKVRYAGKTFLDGNFRHKVNSELTTWNVQGNGHVDILVTKNDSQLWPDLLEDHDPNGEQIMDASLVEETHQRLAHLCSETEVVADETVPGLSSQQLEECDAASEEDTTLMRLDVLDHKITHQIPLSVHQYLFSVNVEPKEIPALVLRHDVDACVWQPYAKVSDNWLVQHQGTLMAFGYVQSSKQNRKFVTCPPNFAYSVVCEASRHIFIYKNSGNDQGSQLTQRNQGGASKQVKVGQQYVFNIDKFGEVLGINAANSHLFILTETSLLVLEIV